MSRRRKSEESWTHEDHFEPYNFIFFVETETEAAANNSEPNIIKHFQNLH